MWCSSRTCFGRVVVAQLVLLCALGTQQQAQAETALRVYSGEYVVELAPKASGPALLQSSAQTLAAGSTLEHLGAQSYRIQAGKAAGLRALTAAAPSISEYDPNDSTCVQLLKSKLVSACSPNFELRVSATPNDPRLADLSGLNASQGIDAPRAWDLHTGSSDVVVAVIDTGVDYRHPDLAANVWTNPGEIAGNGIDDDQNGYVDDVHGINALNGSGNPMDDNGHGTHVSGTIAAQGNNAVGVVGVNWNSRIMGLKFLSANGSGSLAGAVQAINYMVSMKNRGVNVRVSNNSWGGGGFSEPLFQAIARAREAGIVFVAAAGNEANDNDSNPSYPADYPLDNIISVAAVDSDRNIASFSNYGATSVDIAAPGVNILSTTPQNGYQRFSGTSMATPHVSGAMALLFAHQPGLAVNDALVALYDSGLELDSLVGLVRTSRMLNVGRLLHGEFVATPNPSPDPVACTYTAQEISYQPDYSADASPAVQQADEFNFYELSLPFSFSFHNRLVQKVSVSPNGVLYLHHAPTSMDYKNGSAAPLESIAALHTDLSGEGEGLGVRVAVSDQRAVIYWKAQHYGYRAGGYAEVRLVLNADGSIEEYLTFSDPATEQFIQSQSTIGVSGPSPLSATTFASNTAAIHSGLAIRYSASCVEAPVAPQVSSLLLRGVRHGRLTKQLRPGKEFQVFASGHGNGSLVVQASFNGRSCPTQGQIDLSNGLGTLSGALPKVSRGVREMRITIGDSSRSARIKHGKPAARGASRARRVSSKQLQEYCGVLFSQLG
jgi:subtilisin family serine protease